MDEPEHIPLRSIPAEHLHAPLRFAAKYYTLRSICFYFHLSWISVSSKIPTLFMSNHPTRGLITGAGGGSTVHFVSFLFPSYLQSQYLRVNWSSIDDLKGGSSLPFLIKGQIYFSFLFILYFLLFLGCTYLLLFGSGLGIYFSSISVCLCVRYKAVF